MVSEFPNYGIHEDVPDLATPALLEALPWVEVLFVYRCGYVVYCEVCDIQHRPTTRVKARRQLYRHHRCGLLAETQKNTGRKNS